MGQVCGKIEADDLCFDAPSVHKQERATEEVNVQVRVLVPVWQKHDRAKLYTGWEDTSDASPSSEVSDSASSNIQSSGSSDRARQARARRRSSQENAGTCMLSACGSIDESSAVAARAISDTSHDTSQQARRRLHALAAAGAAAYGARVSYTDEEVPSPIEGLTIGAMVGRGSYGRVYKGMYNGSRVAVKVVENVESMPVDDNGVPLEVSLLTSHGPNEQHSGLLLSRRCEFVAAAQARRLSGHSCSGGAAGPKARRLSGHSCSRTGSECWMLFDYCDKGCLLDAVEKGWFGARRSSTDDYTPDMDTVAATALEIASAMSHLHDKGVIHGDLSSNNIMLHSSAAAPHGFTARVGDFGLATKAEDAPHDPPKRAETALAAPPPPPPPPAAAATTATAGTAATAAARPARTASHMLLNVSAQRHSCSSIGHVPPSSRTQPRHGTASYMPPEALVEQVPASKAGDVYAFGVLLWEMLTGRRAWGRLGHPQVVFQVAVLGRSLEIPPGLPPHLHTLLARCLAREPCARCTFPQAVECLESSSSTRDEPVLRD